MFGFQFPLHELRKETVNQFQTNFKVCPECWEPRSTAKSIWADGPLTDPQALRDPRPDLSASQRAVAFLDLTQSGEWDSEDLVGNAHGVRELGEKLCRK